jgi:hypothetical protein
MKIKITVDNRTVEIEIDNENLGYHFKHDSSVEQLFFLITKTIEELKKY